MNSELSRIMGMMSFWIRSLENPEIEQYVVLSFHVRAVQHVGVEQEKVPPA